VGEKNEGETESLANKSRGSERRECILILPAEVEEKLGVEDRKQLRIAGAGRFLLPWNMSVKEELREGIASHSGSSA